jgi:hypothetical protein
MSFWRTRKRPRVHALLWNDWWELVRREAAAMILREVDPRTPEGLQRQWLATIGRRHVERIGETRERPASYAMRTARVLRRVRRIARVPELKGHAHYCRFCGAPWSCGNLRCRLSRDALCKRCYAEWRHDEHAVQA